MKARLRLISNSSSSSFLIYGTCLKNDELRDKLDGSNMRSLELRTFSNPTAYDYGPEYYLGTSWDQVKDDETGAQFKERVTKNIKDLLKQLDPEIDTEALIIGSAEDAWYDG